MTRKQRESLQDELRRLEVQLQECNDTSLRKVISERIAALKEKLNG